MVTKTEIELKNFFIFNSTLASNESQELRKILYYYPITDNTDIQIKNVGLVEGIVQFTETFKPSSSVSAFHTNKTRQLYFQPEKDFWMVMTIFMSGSSNMKDGVNIVDKLEEDVPDNVYKALLKQAYYMYRLFWGTFNQTVDIGRLKTTMETFYNAYLRSLKLSSADISNIFCGIQYLPLDSQTFLKVQCFINSLESLFPVISYTSFLYNNHLIWSGVEPNDMQMIYQYLISTLLPANVEAELQGGSMPRNGPSPFSSLSHGRFITGPTDKKFKNIGKAPKVYLFGSGGSEYHLVVYRALSASVCLFIKGDTELSSNLFLELDTFIGPNLFSTVSNIAEYCSKEVVISANVPDNSPRFIYFNKMNLAYKSTVHLNNKQTGNLACAKESVRIMADIKQTNSGSGCSGETIVKTMNDFWVIAKTSNSREFYISLQQKNASLIEISAEVKKLYDNELKGIFFCPT